MLINIAFETGIRDIHLAEARQYFVCSKIVIFGDVALQSLYRLLRLGIVRFKLCISHSRHIIFSLSFAEFGLQNNCVTTLFNKFQF